MLGIFKVPSPHLLGPAGRIGASCFVSWQLNFTDGLGVQALSLLLATGWSPLSGHGGLTVLTECISFFSSFISSPISSYGGASVL